jgi:UDP-glucose 4-epimerase
LNLHPNETETVLLTGGAGFIGSKIARAYLKAGFRVVVADDFSHGTRERLPDHVCVHRIDICDFDALRDLMMTEQPDVINHHAALVSVRESSQQPNRYLQVNFQGTDNLIRAAASIKVRKFIFASSGGAIYGHSNGVLIDEGQSKKPVSPYGTSKKAAERIILAWPNDFEKVILRYGNVYGSSQYPVQDNGVIAIFTDALLSGKQPIIYGNGLQTRDYIHVTDVVAANLAAIWPGRVGIFNIGTGKAHTVKDVYNQIATALDCEDISPQHCPANPYEVNHNVLKIDKAIRELDWQPTIAFRQGVKQTVRAILDRVKVEA